MKELSIEQKAKCYDEALKVLHKYDGANIMFSQSLKEEIFPELKESEDEKIRKVLLGHFSRFQKEEVFLNDNITMGDIVAWLEKQGEQSFSNTNQECLKGIKRVQEYQDLSDWEKEFDNIASMYAHNKNQEGYNESWYVKERAAAMLYHAKKELEKQGEQYPKFRIGDIIKKKSTSDIVTISEIDLKNREYKLSNTGFIPFKYEHLWELVEQKSAWSDEDEIFVHGLIRGLAAKRDIHKHTTFSSDCIDITETINWLESLKNRVLLYPVSVEYNEEDIDNIADMFIPEPVWNALEESEGEGSNAAAYDYSQMIAMFKAGVHWLKSLKDRYTWKPTEEQIAAVKEVACYSSVFSEKTIDNLVSLSKDLKKLKQ